MKLDADFVMFCVFAAFVIGTIAVGFTAGKSTSKRQFQSDAIRLGHAQYNPTNATFEWKECK